jgi:hypothetical protein
MTRDASLLESKVHSERADTRDMSTRKSCRPAWRCSRLASSRSASVVKSVMRATLTDQSGKKDLVANVRGEQSYARISST